MHSIDAAYCYIRCGMVCVRVCLYATGMNPAKTAALIEMLFGTWALVGPLNRVLDGGSRFPQVKWQFCGWAYTGMPMPRHARGQCIQQDDSAFYQITSISCWVFVTLSLQTLIKSGMTLLFSVNAITVQRGFWLIDILGNRGLLCQDHLISFGGMGEIIPGRVAYRRTSGGCCNALGYRPDALRYVMRYVKQR